MGLLLNEAPKGEGFGTFWQKMSTDRHNDILNSEFILIRLLLISTRHSVVYCELHRAAAAIGNLLYRTVNFQRYCASFPYCSWEFLIAVWVLSRVVLLLQLGKSSYPS